MYNKTKVPIPQLHIPIPQFYHLPYPYVILIHFIILLIFVYITTYVRTLQILAFVFVTHVYRIQLRKCIDFLNKHFFWVVF